jgi:hypothetical protein
VAVSADETVGMVTFGGCVRLWFLRSTHGAKIPSINGMRSPGASSFLVFMHFAAGAMMCHEVLHTGVRL